MPITLIVAAGGTGTRFQKSLSKGTKEKNTSKLFVPFLGKPLLVHTLEQFQGIPEINEIVVTLPADKKKEVKSWSKQFDLKKLSVTLGGKTRAESVMRGLKASKKNNVWVMVHDGARPLISIQAIKKLVKKSLLKKTDGAILASKVIPTIKESSKKSQKVSKTLDRNYLYEAETPQLAKKSLLVKGFENLKDSMKVTDESALLEKIGATVDLVTHDSWNPKITSRQDLKLAEKYLQTYEVKTRVGIGNDIHRLVTKRKLYLGGIHVPSPMGALGHSDGDALLHAIADAVLGCIAKGDIGDYFSDKNQKNEGIKSKMILKKVLAEASKMGWCPEYVDSIITLEKPKLGKYKEIIKKNIATIMNLKQECVSVKAKTHEGLGPLGKSEAVNCEAIVTMKKVVQ